MSKYDIITRISNASSIKSKGESASSTEEDWDADEKEVEREENIEIKIKSPKVSNNKITYYTYIL